MSGTGSIEDAPLDLKQHLARFDRAQAEARRLGREYRFAPFLMLVAAPGSVAAAIIASISLVKLMSHP
jgi:hypothetical protein